MKKSIIIPALISGLLMTSAALAADSSTNVGATQIQETKTVVDPNTVLTTTQFSGSDSLAIGDPLGNSPVTQKHDLGPPSTRRLSYNENCQDEACVRAQKRWNMNTTWEQDRKSGMSLGWGQDYKNTEE